MTSFVGVLGEGGEIVVIVPRSDLVEIVNAKSEEGGSEEAANNHQNVIHLEVESFVDMSQNNQELSEDEK